MSKFQPIAMIECSTSNEYWQMKSTSVYGTKASYAYVLGFTKVLLIDRNSDTKETRLVLVDSNDFYNSLIYKGPYNSNILNVFRH